MYAIGSMQPDVVHTFVIYDPSSGTVTHVHQVVQFHGCRSRPSSEMEEEALESARSVAGRRLPAELRVLPVTVPPEPGAVYRVDPRRRELIREETDSPGA